MFKELVPFVNLLRSVVQDLRAKKSIADQDATISRLLETSFYLQDAVDEGERLVNEAAPDPVAMIASLDPAEADIKLREWDLALRRQAFRLRRVSENIFDQDFIEIVSPGLRDSLYEVIGSKWKRAVSLHGIGSALFFRTLFPLERNNEEKAHFVSVMAGENGNLLHMKKIRRETYKLRAALEAYTRAVNDLAPSDAIMRLS